MQTIMAVLESKYVGAEEYYKVQVDDDATYDEIEEAVRDAVMENLNYHAETEYGEEITEDNYEELLEQYREDDDDEEDY